MKKKNRWRGALSFTCGLMMAAVIMETGFQLIARTPLWQVLPQIEPVLGQPDFDIGYALTPGTQGIWLKENRAKITINSLGLRDQEMSLTKASGAVRIALLGDSHIEALQVDQRETFDALTETLLRQKGYNIEIANLGLSGSGPLRQLVRLEKFGMPLKPDLVMSVTSVQDFMTGELRDDSQNPGYVKNARGEWIRSMSFRDRRGIRYMSTDLGHSVLTALQTFSVPRLLYWRSRDPIPVLLGLPEKKEMIRAETDIADVCHHQRMQKLKDFWLGHQPNIDWQAASLVLDEFSQHSKAHHLPVVFVLRDIPLPPSSCQTELDLRHVLVTRIRQEFSQRGLFMVDFLPILAEMNKHSKRKGYASKEQGSHKKHDHFSPGMISGFGPNRGGGHLNQDGHKLYAEALAPILDDFMKGQVTTASLGRK